MSTPEEKIKNWKNHPSARFSDNFCPPIANGLSRIGALELSEVDFQNLREYGLASSYELLMAFDEPYAQPGLTYNFSPILQVSQPGAPPRNLDFSTRFDVQYLIDLSRSNFEAMSLTTTDENTRIASRVAILTLNIMERLLMLGANDPTRQLILDELRGYMLRLNEPIVARIVPNIFWKAVGSIWWIISDHEIFQLMFEGRNTTRARLNSFYTKEGDNKNAVLYRAFSTISREEFSQYAQGLRIYPSIIPEKYRTWEANEPSFVQNTPSSNFYFSEENYIKIPFSFVFEFKYADKINDIKKYVKGMDLSHSEIESENGEGVLQVEYIHPCPTDCPN